MSSVKSKYRSDFLTTFKVNLEDFFDGNYRRGVISKSTGLFDSLKFRKFLMRKHHVAFEKILPMPQLEAFVKAKYGPEAVNIINKLILNSDYVK